MMKKLKRNFKKKFEEIPEIFILMFTNFTSNFVKLSGKFSEILRKFWKKIK